MKNIIKKILRSVGYEIRRYIPLASPNAQLQALIRVRHYDLVLDIGANVGNYARSLREFGYRGKIVLFEPQSEAYRQLERLAAEDRGIILAPRMALGDHEGEANLNISENSESSSILHMHDAHLAAAPESKYIRSDKVHLQRVDQAAMPYIETPDCSIFAKIDTQGFERQVLDGMGGILHHVKGIQIELSLIPLYEGQLLYREMITLLELLGFELFAILPNFVDNVSGRTYQIDGVFIKPE